MKFVLSNADIRASGTAANTLGLTAIENSDVTLDSTPLPQAPLLAGQTLTITGSATVTVDNTKCSQIVWLCANVEPSGTAYTETDATNNWKCGNIVDNLSCAVGEFIRRLTVIR